MNLESAEQLEQQLNQWKGKQIEIIYNESIKKNFIYFIKNH
jgi:hypothetical protein